MCAVASQDHSLERIVGEAVYLREFMLRFGSSLNEELIAALAPFERDDDTKPPTQVEVRRLYSAFQAAHADVKSRVDPHTLNEVLIGRSPYRTGRRFWNSFGMIALATLLFYLVFYFSNWSTEASHTIRQAERLVNFPHDRELMSVVELREVFGTIDPPPEDFEPYRLYIEGFGRLQDHYLREKTLPGKVSVQLRASQPFQDAGEMIRDGLCGLPVVQGTELCPSESEGSVPPLDGDALWAGSGGEPGNKLGFDNGLDNFNSILHTTMLAAERDPRFVANSGIAVQTIRNYMADLESRMRIVHRWTLPIIYGMLGSIVYCLWTVLHSDRAPHTLVYTALRTAFAGVAAMTLSGLLIPSNTLTLGLDVSQPFIYLLCFVFGYSIEAFINLLNGLNHFVGSNVTPKSREESGKTTT